MRTAIVYYSRHHENTKKLVDAIAASYEVALIDVCSTPKADLSGFDMVGFASGIYYSSFHKSLIRFAEESLPEGTPVFFLYTCGMKRSGYTRAIEAAAAARHARVLGAYGCPGFNTFGPLRLIGGMAKGHPSEAECAQAAAFYGGLLT